MNLKSFGCVGAVCLLVLAAGANPAAAAGAANAGAAVLGERYWRTKAEADRLAWVTALDREGHDFKKRYVPDYGPRGIYKFNREAKLACFVITKAIAEKLGKDSFDAETAEGPVHFEWARQADGTLEYKYTAPTNWDVFVKAHGAKPQKNPKPEANISFSTSFPRKGVATTGVAHHREDWTAGPYAGYPFPTNEIKAADNFVFAVREALPLLGLDRPEAMEGSVWLGTFDSNFPNGHTDFPPHFHVIPCCRDGKQVHHFYVRREDGRITSDCYQDMSTVIDVWDRAVTLQPGTEFPCYDGKGRVAFRVKMIADGTGLELLSPDRARRVRVAGDRPCDAVKVEVAENGTWRTARTVSVRDDPRAGVMETPDGTVRYDPATGKRLDASPANDPFRPQLRYTQAKGWANDPNGMIHWNGEWHFFHQHNPFGVKWGSMHWNHAVSKDLLHWTELGDALAPDALGAMFSGSAVTDSGNTAGFGAAAQVLVYTAAGNEGKPPRPYSQCLAYSTDGRHYEKYRGNPVIDGISPGNRDPKVFWYAPGKNWVMALYGTEDNRHVMWTFNSPDLKSWTKVSTYVGGELKKDKWLYECPGLEEVKIEGESGSAWVVWGAADAYAVGSFDGKTFTPAEERIPGLSLAKGQMPFYAAQTYNDAPDGRKLWVAWFRLPYRQGAAFSQTFSLTQELTLRRTPRGLRLVRRPARELQALRTGPAVPLERFDGELAEVHLDCRVPAGACVEFDLRGVPVRYDGKAGALTVAGTTAAWTLDGDRLALTVFLDRVCAEVFSDDGLQMMPVPDAFPDRAKRTLSLKSGNPQSAAFTAWKLKSIWE